MNKSRPVYRPLQIDPTGRAHLVVTDLAGLPEGVMALDMALPHIEVWTVAVIGPGIQAPAVAGRRAFRAVADLFAHLKHLVGREAVGFRLYAAGSEAFLWDAHNIARDGGMGQGEIFLSHAGSLRRRVYCTHCKTMIENVVLSIAPCPACGANLFVRDHFSRRLSAFMGVAVDAEVPGEIPVAEMLYP